MTAAQPLGPLFRHPDSGQKADRIYKDNIQVKSDIFLGFEAV